MRTRVNPTQAAVDRYVAAFAEFERTHAGKPWLAKRRQEAIARFAELGFPTTRHEEWKYTDITEAANLAVKPSFRLAHEPHLNGAAAKLAQDLPLGDLSAIRLVFVDGYFSADLSNLEGLPAEAEVTNLAAALASDSEVLQEHLGRVCDEATEVFTVLNTAFAQDGAFIRIPANVKVEEPIHLLFVATPDGATVTHPRNLVLLGNGAEATVIESYTSSGEGEYLTNAVTEIVCGANAQLEHIKLQLESEKAYHVGTTVVHGSRNTVAASYSINFGGLLVRNNANAIMGDSNAEITLNGLVVTNGNQLVDNHTMMDHAQPHCASHEIYTHVLGGNSTGVFNGKIFVRLDAQKTDAKQSNRTLLLSPDATINAKPQLEIFADDVKCTHGATIGQMDETALFYLRSRGIPEQSARHILVHAFAAEVFESIPEENVREKLEALLIEKLH